MTTSRAPRMAPTEWLLLVVLSLLWGGSFFFNAVALRGFGTLGVVLGRVALAAVALHILVRALGHRMPRDRGTWRAFAAMGLLNNLIPYGLIVWGQTQIASGLAAILNATTPLFTVVVAHCLTRDERMTAGRVAGVLLGFGGVVAMVGPAALAGLGLDLAAQGACLAAALSYAFAGVFGRRFRSLPPVVTSAGQVTATTVLVLPLVLLVEQPWTRPAPGLAALGAVAALALVCTAAAFWIYFRVLAAAGATNVLLVTFLVPVSAILLGTLVLGERLDPRHFLGMGLIGLGLAAIDGRPVAWVAPGFRASRRRDATTRLSVPPPR